jgi:hypothetical protein
VIFNLTRDVYRRKYFFGPGTNPRGGAPGGQKYREHFADGGEQDALCEEYS